MSPNGIFLSNCPGDPESVTAAIETIRSLLGYRPIFGTCLGHQLLGLTLGGTCGSVAYNLEELEKLAKGGIDASLISQMMLKNRF